MIAPGFVEDALDGLRQQRIPVGPILRDAGLSEEVTAPVSARQYGQLWLAMAKASKDEFFGLAGRPMRPGSFVLLCHAVLHAGNLEKALGRAVRFLNVVLDDPRGQVGVKNGLAEVVLSDAGESRTAFAYRTYWLILHGVMCWLVGRRIPLRKVDFTCAPPERHADYSVFFGAPVSFHQQQGCLAFDAEYLKMPTIRSEQGLERFLRRAPANILVRYRHDEGFTSRVRRQFRDVPASSWPNFEQSAKHLRVSTATLRRQLRAEGQSFSAIKYEIQAARAYALLRDSNQPVAEVAAELGFTEPSAFHRAFRKWTGQSPGAFRRTLRQGAKEAISHPAPECRTEVED